MDLSRLNKLFFNHNCVVSMDIELVDFKYHLTMTMSSSDEPETGVVTAVFRDVSELKLSGFGGGLSQFMDVVVTRIDDGLDRIRYELRDIEDEKISFYFFSFSVLGLEESIGGF